MTRKAKLAKQNLSHVNLSSDDLTEAQLSEADLSHATLKTTNLSGADLTDANLAAADLEGANVESALQVPRARLRGAKGLTAKQRDSLAARNAIVDAPHTGREHAMESLSEERCVACRKDAPRVTEADMAELAPQIPDWELIERDGVPRLRRTFRFPDFARALAFTDRVGALAESEGHHPAILTEWGKVTVTWWTHKIRGLHRNDFVMAAKTDRLPREHAPNPGPAGFTS